MTGSEHSRPRSHWAGDDAEMDAVPAAETTDHQEMDDDIDSFLDEIDDVLEVNAEEFVRSFVQKGGQ